MRILFTILGVFAIGVGAIGIVLPVLPTTPFLLLALVCFSKGSEKMRLWFKSTVLYKKYLQEYMIRKALTLKQKIGIQIFVGIVMLVSFVVASSLILRVLLVFCFVIHNYVFVFKIKTYRGKERDTR